MGACTSDSNVFGHVRTFGVVLLLLVAVAADGTNNHRRGATAPCSGVAQSEAPGALGKRGSGDVLTRLRGTIPKEIGRLTDDVLESGPILVKEDNRYRAMAGSCRPGRQPVGVAENNKVLERVVPPQLVAQRLS